MTIGVVVIVTLIVFLTLLLCSVPIAFALGGSGALGLLLLDGDQIAASTLESLPFTSSAKYALIVLPLFILMGSLLGETGIAREIYRSANRLLGWIPGGLAVSTIFACTLFGGVSGSSTADAATIGRVSIGEMTRHGYRSSYAASVVAAAGTIAILIPPSIILVMFGVLTGESIGELLVAGIVPGVLVLLLFSAYAVFRGIRGNALDERISEQEPVMAGAGVGAGAGSDREVGASRETELGDAVDIGESKGSDFLGVLYAFGLFAIVMGGIYSGVFTSTEAAAVGAFAALVICVLSVRSSAAGGLIRRGLVEASSVNAMMFAILVGGAIFTYFLVSAGVPAGFTQWATGLDVPSWLVAAMLVGTLIPLGMVLDGLSTLLVTVPLSYPAITALGYDGIWFGVVVVVAIEIGLLTPPVGLNVFVIAGLPGAPRAEKIFVGVLPFVALQFFMIALLFAVPDIATWLPSQVSL